MTKTIEKILIAAQIGSGVGVARSVEGKISSNVGIEENQKNDKKEGLTEEEIYNNLKDEKARWNFWMNRKGSFSIQQIEALAMIENLNVAYNFKNMFGDISAERLKDVATYLNSVIKNNQQREGFYTLQRCGLIDLSKPVEELQKENWGQLLEYFKNEYQAIALESVIFYRNGSSSNNYKIRGWQQILDWIKALAWIDDQKKLDFFRAGRLPLFVTLDNMDDIRSITEEVCSLDDEIYNQMKSCIVNTKDNAVWEEVLEKAKKMLEDFKK
ncbi:MAG TPA: hypothetical protein PLH37_03180 [bacterium]|nr:hypothetical protein [bacterium]